MKAAQHRSTRFRIVLIAAAALCAHGALGSTGAPGTDDSDLSAAPVRGVLGTVPLELHADEIRVVEGRGERQNSSLQVEILREERGQLKAVDGLPITLRGSRDCVAGGKVRAEAELRQSRFSVTNGNGTYRISDEIPCSGRVQLIFKGDSNGGQALGIWSIARIAEAKLQAAIGLTFWNTPITFIWPDTADYYNWNSVHISRGDHWDVVGHELGHAIYDLGDLGGWGGGQHKIDECYSSSLALSEGWASFFSAWLSVESSDADAKFEFMVPRRAPIRFESIPADVCRGENNEWRVIGFFWDLHDINNDGESSTESFARMWKALAGSRAPSASAARDRLRQAGIDPAFLEIAWKLNF